MSDVSEDSKFGDYSRKDGDEHVHYFKVTMKVVNDHIKRLIGKVNVTR